MNPEMISFTDGSQFSVIPLFTKQASVYKNLWLNTYFTYTNFDYDRKMYIHEVHWRDVFSTVMNIHVL